MKVTCQTCCGVDVHKSFLVATIIKTTSGVEPSIASKLLRSLKSKEDAVIESIEGLVKRRGKKRAIIAIARMILTAIYQMRSTGEVWNPSDLYKIDMPETLVEKQKAKSIL